MMKQVTGISVRMKAAESASRKPLIQEIPYGRQQKNSRIRDCSIGPFYITGGSGSFLFRNCHMTGSEGPGWYDATRKSKLVFERCSFGYQESAMYPGADNGERFKDCVWWEGRDAYAAG